VTITRPRPLVLLAALATALILAVGTMAAPAQAIGTYTPPQGVKLNNPLGAPKAKRSILDHVLRTIRSVPRGETIRIASWNFRSPGVADALIAAHRRNVSVRVIVSRGNANRDNPNEVVNRLQTALAGSGNAQRAPDRKSGLVRCVSACRGAHGIAHSKFFLFSRAGRARNVVMNGSWNATDLATYNQWNDLFTRTGDGGLYREFNTVFDQMFRDRNVAQGYRERDFGDIESIAFPWRGAGTNGDPVLRELARVQCRGALNSSDGRTKLRISMTAWHGDRGKAIARRVTFLRNHGCDVAVVYAVAGNEVLNILRNGGAQPVPLRQITQDFNHDGVYDRYLHMKVLTIRGVYAGNRRAYHDQRLRQLVPDRPGQRRDGAAHPPCRHREALQRLDRVPLPPPAAPGPRGGAPDDPGRTGGPVRADPGRLTRLDHPRCARCVVATVRAHIHHARSGGSRSESGADPQP